jgi:glycosyltransferase involved in cell wall biosynthesis
MSGPRILVLCHATVGSRMASPGIRSFNVARVLQAQVAGASVTLAIRSTSPSDLDPSTVDFAVTKFDNTSLVDLVRAHDIIISNRFPLKVLPHIRHKRVVLDLYTPFITEWIEMTKSDPGPSHRRAWVEMKRKDLMTQLSMADVVLTANERQRDLVAGIMGTAGLISPRMYDTDTSLDRLLKVAPLGIRSDPPVAGAPLLRGVWPGIGADDFIMIWNGTIVEWYDLDLLLRAVHRVSQHRPNIRLFFMGTEHPDSHGSKLLQGLGGGTTRKAIELARELGIYETNVLFNFTWADNDETKQYLLESDASICVYFDGLETRYSFRVRYLDLLWASLPMIITRGDVVAELVDEEQLGLTVPEHDLDALTAAIDRLAGDAGFRRACAENVRRVRERFTWENTLQPLVEFCEHPDTVLTRRSEQALPIVQHTMSWAVSSAHYAARFTTRRLVREWRQRREERAGGEWPAPP